MSNEIDQKFEELKKERTVKVSPEIGQKIKEILEQKGEKGFLELTNLESENQQLREQLEQQKQELEKNGGKGSLPASLNSGEGHATGNNREYEGATVQEAYANMIDDLRAKGDTETLNKLLLKGLGAFKTNFEVKDNWKDGKSCVRHVLDSQNKKARGS